MPPGGISSRLRGLPRYPRLASIPSLEIIHLSALPTLSASWLGPHKYQSYCFILCVAAFLGSEVSVSNQTKPFKHADIHSFAQRNMNSVNAGQHGSSNSCCFTPFVQSWNDLAATALHNTVCFPKKPFQFTEFDTLWENISSVAFTSNYRLYLAFGTRARESKMWSDKTRSAEVLQAKEESVMSSYLEVNATVKK